MDNPTSYSPTLAAESPTLFPEAMAPGLDLKDIPPIAVLSAHFQKEEEFELKETLRRCRAPLTSDLTHVNVFIGKVGTKRRAEFELRSRKFGVEEFREPKRATTSISTEKHARKKRKTGSLINKAIPIEQEGSTTEEESESETEDEGSTANNDVSAMKSTRSSVSSSIFENLSEEATVWVIRVEWLDQCLSVGHIIPLGEHLVYKGKILERPPPAETKHKSVRTIFSSNQAAPQTTGAVRSQNSQTILDRAKFDVFGKKPDPTHLNRSANQVDRSFNGKKFTSSAQHTRKLTSRTANLLQKTTSEYEGEDNETPQPPGWVKSGIKFACQRFTPADGPNEDFITLLKKIRTARTLVDDEVGVRAYSTIIAAIAAYPFKLTHPREIAQIPGCDEKTAILFVEWKNMGKIQVVEDYENDEAMKILRLFYGIWGVGAKTARHFYYSNNWTELDDIIEFGWNDLDRVQQIGVKYYDEFQEPIPRAEAEQIASVVRERAVRCRDERITVTIVGGYRRGKATSGDVDVIVSHPDLEATAGLVQDIVESLEDSQWITHTLTMSLHNTLRGQSTLEFRSRKNAGSGFDTLDKALVVWQDPAWHTRQQDVEANPKAKNPNIHRRVDIIVAPWRTVGCAVLGWSGGTTFQRDLRRYAKHVKGWKFDSSGIRTLATGEVVQLEGPEGVNGTPEEAERRVFEGLGLEFVPPDQRCTY